MTAQNFMLIAKEKLAKIMLQNTAKCCKIMVFLNIFKRGSYKNCSIDVKFGMDTLEYTDYVYTKFQASTTLRNLCVLTQKCNFSTKIAEKGRFSYLTRS